MSCNPPPPSLCLPDLQLILELCRDQPDAEVIAPHLERIRAPAALSSTSDYSKASLSLQLYTSHICLHCMFFVGSFFVFAILYFVAIILFTLLLENCRSLIARQGPI